MTKHIIDSIKGKLIVSCQARPGWAMYGSDIMVAFAKAAEEGGAVAIRATGAENLAAIKENVNLPLIGINKIFDDKYEVYITPTYESAKAILEIGIEIIALDATNRSRPNNETFASIVKQIHQNFPDTLIMAEVSTLEEAKQVIENEHVDLISTTLSGYTESSKTITTVNLDLIKEIKAITSMPIIAEGKIETKEDAVKALEAGAYSVVVGTSITRPEIITKRFVEALKEFEEN